MKIKSFISPIIITAWIFISSCNPTISTSLSNTYPPLDYKHEVVVIGMEQEQPPDAEVLGQVKIGDSGFTTNCGYDIVLEKAKLEARKVGGNAIKIIEHNPPTIMGSNCHRIRANILKIADIEKFIASAEDEIIPDADYAILHVYRYSGSGAFVSYDVYLGDSVICRVKNNFKKTLQINKDGMNTLWARTESKSEVPINIKMGRTYYLRCGISMGALVGRPKLELVGNRTGKAEFESFKARNQ